jgi:hypothetical protein
MYLGVPGLVRGVFNIGAGLAARFFAREAVETAAETTARGLSMEGLAFERRFLSQHLEGISQAANQIARDGKAFVFNDLSTMSRVESEIFSRGAFTGTTTQGSRTWARYGLEFERPIGVRIAQDGTRTPLTYGQINSWEASDSSIRVFPKSDYRDPLLQTLLEIKIAHVVVRKSTVKLNFREALTHSAELKILLESYGVRPLNEGFSPPDFETFGGDFSLDLENMSVRSILDSIIHTTKTKYWFIKRDEESKKFFLINF